MKNLEEIKFDEKKRTQAGMTVPEGFFDQFKQQMEAKIDTLEAIKQTPVIEMPQKNKFNLVRWAVAACAAVLLVFGIIAYYQIDNNAKLMKVDQVASNDSSDEDYNMEDMVIRSVNDFELYEFYCDLQ